MAKNEEPGSAPKTGRWYDLKLGSSFKDQSSTKFCTLRYEFKPASIDKNQAGSLLKNKENRVTVEFLNNQPGKPKVTFEGSSEDYKDNDGVLFFDGETVRLERLNRAVKRLRHVRLPGESATTTAVSTTAITVSATAAGTGTESRSPPVGKIPNKQTVSKTVAHPVPVEVERIDIGDPDSPGTKPTSRNTDHRSVSRDPFSQSPDPKPDEPEESFDLNLDDDGDDGGTPEKASNSGGQAAAVGFDINMPHQDDMDDEIADVDDSDDEAGKGRNAAEALRAQVNAEEVQQQSRMSSSSSDSSKSGSSSSNSGSSSSSSSSSGSGGSNNDTASSAGDIEI